MQYSSQFKVRLFTSGRHHIQYCRPADVPQFPSWIHARPECRLVLCREFQPADKPSWWHQDGNTARHQFQMLCCWFCCLHQELFNNFGVIVTGLFDVSIIGLMAHCANFNQTAACSESEDSPKSPSSILWNRVGSCGVIIVDFN